MANPTIDLLFKVAGGAELNSGSGREIKRDIDAIVQAIQSNGTTDLDFKVSQKSLDKLKEDIKKSVQNIQVTFDGKQIGTGGAGGQGSSNGKYLSSEASQLNKLTSLYKEYNNIRVKAAKAPAGSKEQITLQTMANKKLEEARQLRKDYNLDGKRTAAVNNLIKESYLKAADAISLYEARQKDANSAKLSNPSQLFAIEQQIQAFEREFTNISGQGFLKANELSSYKAELDSIIQEFRRAAGEVKDFDKSFSGLGKAEIDGLQSRIENLRSGLKSAHSEASQYTVALTKNANSFNKLSNRAQDYLTRVEKTLSRNPTKLRELQTLVERLHNMDFRTVAEGSAEFQKLQYQIKQAGLESETLFQTISRVFKTKFGYGLAGVATLKLRQELMQIYQNVVDIDTKLTELRIVSGATGSEMVKYFDKAAESAKRVAASITDIIDATTVYRRLGFDMSKSLDFAELTTMYSKVGNVDMSDAESNITAIIKAFNLDDASKLRQAMDQLVAVGNNYAISSSQLGEGLNNAASSLVAAGNSFEQSLALLTAANTITQDASKSSTAMRTIAARLSQSSTELEDLNEEIDAAYNTTSKYREKLLAITGVDILKSDGKSYKATYDILRELASVWEQLSGVDQASVTYMVAGTRQANVFNSIMTQFKDAEGVIQTVSNATGAMETAYSAYVDSIEGRMNTLKATMQELSTNLLDDDLIKSAVSGVNDLAEAINFLVDKIGLLPIAVGGIGLAKLVQSVGGAKMIALISAPTYVPVVTRNECAA